MDYLSSGFKNVDSALDSKKYSTCLEYLNTLEFFKLYKKISWNYCS